MHRPAITRPEHRLGKKPANAGRTFPAQILNEDEVRRMIDACPIAGIHRRTGVRDRALIALLHRTGVRIREALDLQVTDVHEHRDPTGVLYGVIHVMRGKGNKRRPLAVDPTTMQLLTEWLQLRAEEIATRGNPDFAGPGWGPVFCVMKKPTVGRELHDAQVRESLKYRAAKAGIYKRVHPHGMRHSWTFDATMEGLPSRVIQLQLGHKHLSTTEHYMNHLAPHQLIEIMRLRSWSLVPGVAMEPVASLDPTGRQMADAALAMLRTLPPEIRRVVLSEVDDTAA